MSFSDRGSEATVVNRSWQLFLNVGSLKGVDERIRGKTAEVGMKRSNRNRKELKT